MPREARVARDPLFDHFERHVDDVMQQLFRRRSTPASYQRTWAPRVDVYEAEREFILVAELPGVDPDAVTFEVEEQEVTIQGERAVPTDRVPGTRGTHCLQLEIPFGAFERSLVLPAPVDASRASGTADNGMLIVRLPKIARRPQRVQVNIR